MPETEPLKLSRRTFLRGAGVAIGAVASVGVAEKFGVISNILEKFDPTAECLDFYGLKPFSPFFKAAISFEREYGIVPPLCDYIDMGTEYDPYRILKNLAVYFRNNPDKTEQKGRLPEGFEYRNQLARIKEGWGSKIEEAIALAVNKYKVVPFISEGSNDVVSDEASRSAAILFAQLFPYHALIGADYVRIIDPQYNAGWNGGNLHRGGRRGAVLFIPSARESSELFYLRLLHEHSHAEQSKWDMGKPYITMENYAGFIREKIDCIKETLDEYLDEEWDEAQKFKGGKPLLDNCPFTHEALKKLEEYFTNQHLIRLSPRASDQDLIYRYNQLAHAVGKRTRKTFAMGIEANQLPKCPEAEQLLQALIFELDHYFAGPVQKGGGGLPNDITEIADNKRLLTKMNIQIQRARLSAFSQVPIKPFSSNNSWMRYLREFWHLN